MSRIICKNKVTINLTGIPDIFYTIVEQLRASFEPKISVKNGSHILGIIYYISHIVKWAAHLHNDTTDSQRSDSAGVSKTERQDDQAT